VRRREFIALLGGATTMLPLAARAQQAAKETAMPAIGFLRSTPHAPFQNLVAAFGQCLKEAGFVRGQNVAIEYRYADNQIDRLPALVADLIASQWP
jgi:putative ABC transport system substrate-binding protein